MKPDFSPADWAAHNHTITRFRRQYPYEVDVAYVNDGHIVMRNRWCATNCGDNGVAWSAVGLNSGRVRYFFANPTRAVEFKLKFG